MTTGNRGIGSRFDLKFALVTVLCMVGAGASAYLLVQDFNMSGGAGLGDPLAVVEKRELLVRRKPAKTYIWTNVSTEEKLYKKDAIQTSNSSAATIRLNDGSILEMGENSLIIIDENMGEIPLNFMRGNLLVRKSGQGESRVVVGADGKARFEQLPIWLAGPENLSQFFIEKTNSASAPKDVLLSWNTQTNIQSSSYLVEVSKDKNFTENLTQKFSVTNSAQKELSVKLTPGLYYWKVTGDKTELKTSPRQFRVIEVASLKPVWPVKGQKVAIWKDINPIQFRWSAASAVDLDEWGKHSIEIASSSDFSKIISESPATAAAGGIPIRSLPTGQLFWRLKSKYPDLEITSSVESFRLDRTESLALELGKPNEQDSVGMDNPVRFNWFADSDNIEFNWQITDNVSSEENLKTLADLRTKAKVAIWKNTKPGTYKWRVQALFENKVVAASEWRTLNVSVGNPIVLKYPKKDDEIYYWKDPIKFTFLWERDAAVESNNYTYQVETAADLEFQKIIGKTQSSTNELESNRIRLMKGVNFWRVSFVDTKGKILKTGEPSKFTYGIHPPLRAPSSITPDNNSKINLIEQDGDILATWSEVEGAITYEVEVSPLSVNDAKAEKPFKLKTQTKELKTILKDITPGRYSIQVRSIDQLNRLGEPSETRNFIVTEGDFLAPPEAISPEVQ